MNSRSLLSVFQSLLARTGTKLLCTLHMAIVFTIGIAYVMLLSEKHC